jgi:hypothetical protein
MFTVWDVELCEGETVLRRSVFYQAPAVIACLLFLAPISSAGDVPGKIGLEVREPRGLARGGYPAHALLKLPRRVTPATKFRLVHDGKPVVAQFRPDGETSTGQWWLDFQTQIAPYETRRYTVEFGENVPAGPERSGGHKLTEAATAFLIANAPYITWTVPRDLKGFLRSVDFPPSEFLRPDSPGLVLRDRQGRQHAFTGTARVVRQGPMAVALRFESQPGLPKVRSVADLTFPASVSWVELDWHIEDPLDNVAALGLQVDLKLEKASPAAPTLIDFGATSVVYTALRQGQEAELNAGPLAPEVNRGDGHSWKILRGNHGQLTPFALGPKQAVAPCIEGWTHVMDRKNCLALAIDAFARDAFDRINVTVDGRVTVWREYPGNATGRKRLRLWLHFVFFPPQFSAGASPQQMQNPLEVRVAGR